MDVQKHFEDTLIRRVAMHAAFVRSHGRYPATLEALWPTLALLLFFASIEGLFWLAGWWDNGHVVNFSINVLVFVSLAVVNVRALFFRRLRTGLAPGEGMQALQVSLAAAGFSLEWTEARDAAVLFARRGRGASNERHAIVFIPADGFIWYNVQDPRGSRFLVTNRKPLRNLIHSVEKAMEFKEA